jgi:hypothetical protein
VFPISCVLSVLGPLQDAHLHALQTQRLPPQNNGDISPAGSSSGAMGDQIPVIDLENPDTALLIDQVSVQSQNGLYYFA